MLSAVTNSVARAAVRSAIPRAACVRFMCADTHDDFKPVRKVPPPTEFDDKVIKENKVVLFMKGTPDFPMCGFSQQAVRVLHAEGVDFVGVNVLESNAIREGVKKYSNWPTIPQLYVNGEFVGGCDIVTTLHKSGELQELMESAKAKKNE